MDKEERIYWLSSASDDTKAHGGIYWRSGLGEFIERVEKQFNKKVVAIRLMPDFDNKEKYSWNLEILTEPRED
jgi:hypothetical protein